MGNWLFLMLLYAFFGWMKKKQKDKFIKNHKNLSQNILTSLKYEDINKIKKFFIITFILAL